MVLGVDGQSELVAAELLVIGENGPEQVAGQPDVRWKGIGILLHHLPGCRSVLTG
jgi:hypothetical protein